MRYRELLATLFAGAGPWFHGLRTWRFLTGRYVRAQCGKLGEGAAALHLVHRCKPPSISSAIAMRPTLERPPIFRTLHQSDAGTPRQRSPRDVRPNWFPGSAA